MGGIKVKKEGFLKLVLSILIIVLLCLVSLGGVYWKNKNIMENKVKDYNLGMDLGTNTLIKLEVAKEEEKSSEENNQTSEEGQASEENKAEKTYSIDDYKKSKKIIEKRLEIAKIEQYTIRLNENSGDVIIEATRLSTVLYKYWNMLPRRSGIANVISSFAMFPSVISRVFVFFGLLMKNTSRKFILITPYSLSLNTDNVKL